jgi:hypothetical protein
MRRVYILVEGPSDAAFLRRILPEEVLGNAELVTTGGRAGIPSLARSVLVRRKSPVAIVMDSDSIDPEVIEERQQSTEELIRAADISVPVKVVCAIPEIEAWFFVSRETVERVVGQKVSEEELFLGQRDPRGMLQRLAERGGRRWDIKRAISELDTSDVEQIRGIPEVGELSEFLLQVQKDFHDRIGFRTQAESRS